MTVAVRQVFTCYFLDNYMLNFSYYLTILLNQFAEEEDIFKDCADLFAATVQKSSEDKKKNDMMSKAKNKQVAVLDGQKSQNMNIMLAKFGSRRKVRVAISRHLMACCVFPHLLYSSYAELFIANVFFILLSYVCGARSQKLFTPSWRCSLHHSPCPLLTPCWTTHHVRLPPTYHCALFFLLNCYSTSIFLC